MNLYGCYPTFARIQWDENIIPDVYSLGLGGGTSIPCTRRTQILDGNSYLEQVLWPDAREASVAYVLSIIIMVNEKFRGNLSVWSIFHAPGPASFASLFNRVITLDEGANLTLIEKTARVIFLINAMQS